MNARFTGVFILLACLLSPANAQTKAAQGEYLVRAGGCMSCHTADPARPFAGGRPIATPFGNVYAPNITSDRETGIGAWTDAQFIQTMHTGVSPEGRKLDGKYMPWQAVGTLSDDELRGLLMALKEKKGA